MTRGRAAPNPTPPQRRQERADERQYGHAEHDPAAGIVPLGNEPDPGDNAHQGEEPGPHLAPPAEPDLGVDDSVLTVGDPYRLRLVHPKDPLRSAGHDLVIGAQDGRRRKRADPERRPLLYRSLEVRRVVDIG